VDAKPNDVVAAGIPGHRDVATLPAVAEPQTCPRHPDVETRLSCSACGDTICPNCAREAAVGYKCPDCARQNGAAEPRAGTGGLLSRLTAGRDDSGPSSLGGRPGGGDVLPWSVGARGTVVGVAAAILGGLLLGPVLAQGTFFLLSSGVIGWAVARAVFWATDERSSPYLKAMALTVAGFTVAVGLVTGQDPAGGGRDLALLAFPAAMYGGWIAVRSR
jgi:hypothetical protein